MSSRISGSMYGRPNVRYTSSSVAPAICSSSRKIPYSFSLSPFFCAIVRSLML